MDDPKDRCPRCGAAFACGMGGPGPCACVSVPLDAAVLAALRARYVGCLCGDCLRALAQDGTGAARAGVSATGRPPASPA